MLPNCFECISVPIFCADARGRTVGRRNLVAMVECNGAEYDEKGRISRAEED